MTDARDDEEIPRTFREAREYARGELDVDHDDVHPIAGLVADDKVRRVLSWMADHYQPSHEELEAGLPRDFFETDLARRVVRKHATDQLTRAVREGNGTQTAYMTGLPSYRSDVSGLHAINQLASWLVHSEQCKLVYMAALMGRGKTDFSALMLEVVHDHYRRVAQSVDEAVPTPEFASNFYLEPPSEVDAEVREISHYRDLVAWGEQGSSDDVRWFIFDEASTELTAQSGSNAQDVAETMAPFVKKMRKMGINMVVIGHDKRDVHPAIRSIADFVAKGGTKTASFYAGIKKREPTGHLFDLEGIPPTSWTYDTDDTAEWCWCDEASGCAVHGAGPVDEGMSEEEWHDEIKRRAARIYVEGPEELTLDDVASAMSTDAYSLSTTTVSRAAKTLKNERKATETQASA